MARLALARSISASHLQLTRRQAGLPLRFVGHDTQYIVPALFTHIPKYVPSGCLFQLQESSARAAATEAVNAARQQTAPNKISRMIPPIQIRRSRADARMPPRYDRRTQYGWGIIDRALGRINRDNIPTRMILRARREFVVCSGLTGPWRFTARNDPYSADAARATSGRGRACSEARADRDRRRPE
jgi:hypothetical protein